MRSNIKNKLKNLPGTSGVYFFTDKNKNIIYIGKASNLKRRVTSYFQKKHLDNKTPVLVKKIDDIRVIQTNSEIEALFLEAEYIKRHKPLYNVELRDDKNFIYIKVTVQEDFPAISLVRRPTDDKARYYGPFVQSYQVKQALRYLRRIFPYYSKPYKSHSSKLEYQIGVVPNPTISKDVYRSNIRKLLLVFEGKSSYIIKQLEKEMTKLSKQKKYEQASIIRNQYLALKGLSTKIVFGSEESINLSLDVALSQLTKTLELSKIPKRIECYDISNFAGGDAVSSMIVFTDGMPDQKQYRHFKMSTKGPNDFAMIYETLVRRFKKPKIEWPYPQLIIIDGGKGQLSSAMKALTENGIHINIFGLAKKFETIIKANNVDNKLIFSEINFAINSPALHLLQRIRDEAHRFAVSYHKTVRKKRTKSSQLDSIVGIGPVTKRKLIRHFGSVSAVKKATSNQLIEVVGKSKAQIINEHLI